jgi:hypothetical protein
VSLLEIQKGLLDLKHAVNVPDVLDILVANRVVTVEQNAAENHPISLDLSNSTKNLLLSSLKDEPANLAQVVKATLKRLVELQSHVRITTSITTTSITTTSITTTSITTTSITTTTITTTSITTTTITTTTITTTSITTSI